MRKIKRFLCIAVSCCILCMSPQAGFVDMAYAASEDTEIGQNVNLHIGDIVEYRGIKYSVYNVSKEGVFLRKVYGARQACTHEYRFESTETTEVKISGNSTYCYKSKDRTIYECVYCGSLNIIYSPYVNETHMFFGGKCENVVNGKQCTAKG